MTPKQRRLKVMRKNKTIIKTKRIVFGVVYLTIAVGSIAIILGSLQ
jgi:hypothetical protein